VTWGDDHSRSERLASAADLALRSGKADDAERLYREAAAAEVDALASLTPDKHRTIGITAVSAVALWYKARQYREAEAVAYRSLASNTLPAFAMRQLQHLLQMLWAATAAEQAGRRFVPGDVLVSVKGGVVVPGGAPLDLIQQKVEGIQAVLYRVVEMLLGTPLRRRGGPAPDIQAAFRPWLFQAPAGSYQFAVRVEEPQQMELFAKRPEIEQVTSLFFSVLRASAADPEADLASLVPDKGYREAFLNLSRNLAPTGKSFDSIEIRDASTPAAEPVVLQTDSRRQLNTALRNIRPPRSRQTSEQPEEVKGVLRGLQLDQDWLEVVQSDPSKPVRIYGAGDVLDDVVGPMVNHRVVVTTVNRRGRLVFQDIEAEE
jgi:hypothetical protein